MKKELYQKYLKTNQHISELIIEIDKIQEKEVKTKGVIYTPKHIADHMVYLSQPTHEKTIIEPSCGHGIFLFALLDYMKKNEKLENEKLLDWFLNKVTALEFNPITVTETKELLSLYFQKNTNQKPSENIFNNIIVADSLFYEHNKIYDLCIGNPPYVSIKNIEENYLNQLRENFKSCQKGNIDLYFAFTEKYKNLSKELCFITPNSFLTSQAGKLLRNEMIDYMSLLIDFKEKYVFKDARTFTCIFKTLREHKIEQCLYANNINEELKLKDKKEIILDQQSKDLDSGITNYLGSIATSANKLYKVKKENEKYFTEFNGKKFEIEKEILAPYLKIVKVKNEDISNIDYMIFPYNDEKELIKEKELKQKYPKAYKYLKTIKPELEKRNNGKIEEFESWYSYAKKSGMYKITEKEIVTIPALIGGECKPVKINIENLLDNFGRVVFTDGFVIPNNTENKKVCDFILSEQFVEQIKKTATVFANKPNLYYKIAPRDLKKLKI